MAKSKGRTNVSMADFLAAAESSNSVPEIAAKTTLKLASVQARLSKYRVAGIPIKNFPRGGGARLDPAKGVELLAQLRGVDVSVVQAEAKAAAKKRDKK